MKALQWLLLAAISVLASGCIPSLHKLYTEEDLIRVPKMEGTWFTANEDPNAEDSEYEEWHFERIKKKRYELRHVVKGHEARFKAHFVRLNDVLFLDLYPEDLPNDNYLYELHIYPMHTFSRILLDGDKFELALLDSEWFEDQYEDDKLNVDFVEGPNESVIITAKTAPLQKFVSSISDNEDAWSDPINLSRK